MIFQFLAMASPPGGGGGSFLGNPIFMIVAIIGIFYFMIIRPQQKRAKQQQAMIAGVKRGDQVVMSGGMHGTVFEVKETTLLIELTRNTVVEFDKGAVQTVVAST